MWSFSEYVSAIVVLMSFLGVTPVANAAPSDNNNASSSQSTHDRTLHLPGDKRHTFWIPGNYQLQGKKVDVLFNFHGHAPLVQSSTRLAGINCMVISINYAGLSSVYRVPFSNNRQLFATILDEALETLRAQPDFPHDAQWGKIAISSFSAGFGAVREILKTQDYFDRVNGIYMVDSLYCGYIGDGTDNLKQGVVHPGLMKDFLRYAQASADGNKVMIITHCVGPTPGYASTRETADYLLDKLDIESKPVDIKAKLLSDDDATNEILQLYRKAKHKGFSLYGSPGGNETDHVKHLRHMAYFLPGLPLEKRDSSHKRP